MEAAPKTKKGYTVAMLCNIASVTRSSTNG